MPSSAPPCRSSARNCARPSISARDRRCSTSLPATATRRSPPRVAGATWSPTDYVPALLERARERAAAERLDIEFREADAEALPFADESFDVVVSTFGVMFTPDQDRAAAELVRVCKRGGRIGLANWTPEGFIGQLFKTIGKHAPPPAGARSPALWGTRARIAELFEPHATSVKSAQRDFVFRYRSPAHWLEVFRTYYGPVHKTFGALEPAAQAALAARPRGADRAVQPLGRRHDGRAERVPRDRHHAALTNPDRTRKERPCDTQLESPCRQPCSPAPSAQAPTSSPTGTSRPARAHRRSEARHAAGDPRDGDRADRRVRRP